MKHKMKNTLGKNIDEVLDSLVESERAESANDALQIHLESNIDKIIDDCDATCYQIYINKLRSMLEDEIEKFNDFNSTDFDKYVLAQKYISKIFEL